MSIAAFSTSRPASSGEMPILDTERAELVTQRHGQLAQLMTTHGWDAILLQDPASFSWLTVGGDNTSRGNEVTPVATILVTGEARVVLCNNIDSGQIFDRDLMGLGFLVKERPWTESLEVLKQDVCRARRVGCDVCLPGTEPIGPELAELRCQLSPREITVMRELGRDVAHALEATARNFEFGSRESEVAGHLAHRLMKRGVQPVKLQVMADAQGWRYRHWSYGNDRIERHCILSAVGRRLGLHVGASRSVCIGAPSEELQNVHLLAMLVQSSGMFFSQPGWQLSETWKRIARIYEKFETPDEWRSATQAEVLGYHRAEYAVTPQTDQTLRPGMAIFWHPSVRASLVGDTILVTESGGELLTPGQNWPMISVKVKGNTIERPSLLIREFAPEHAVQPEDSGDRESSPPDLSE